MSFRTTFSITALLSACVAADEPRAPAPPSTTTAITALACATYTVTDLGIPSGGGQSSATAIDDGGNVAGTFRPTTFAEPVHAFRWSADDGFVDLGTLGGPNSLGYGVSSAGVVGESRVASGDTHAFLSDATGIHDLGTLGGSGIDASRARAINAAGVIVGESRLADGNQRAARYHDGTATDLGSLLGPQTGSSVALAINAAGVIVGQSSSASGRTHAAKWANGAVIDLGSIGTATSVATAVNAAGDAAGNLLTNFSPRPARFAGGTVTELGILPGFERGTATGINDAGQIVGTITHQSNEATPVVHGYLFDGVQIDLNTVVAGEGWEITAANAINNAGQIAGAGVSTATGMGVDRRVHALVLTPTCVPTTPDFRSLSTVTNGTTIAAPDDVAAGDFLIAALEYDADPLTITPPAGWTLVADQLAGEGTAQVFHALVYTHVATANEPAEYTFASPPDVYVDIQIAAYTGVTGIDAIASTGTVGDTISAPSVTTTGPDRVLVAIFIDYAGGTWTVADGMTERSSFDSNSLQDEARPTAGPTGPRTASDAEGAMTAISIALK